MAPPALLTDPRHRVIRIIDRLGRAAEAIGLRPFRLEADALIDKARRKTGLDDMGPEWTREGLDVLCAGLTGEYDPGPFGRLAVGSFIGELLADQLRLTADRARDPQIAEVAIEAPIVIAGLFRTGTTLLHRMLARHPDLRGLSYAELRYPSPPPGLDDRADARRLDQTRVRVRQSEALNPAVQAMHWMQAETPEEENWADCRRFESMIFEFSVHAPAYADWLRQRDPAPRYRALRRELQNLTRHRPGRLILKAPAHLWHLDALRAEFPDAWIIRTHREVEPTFTSMCTLIASIRKMFCPRLDPVAIGRHFVGRVAEGLERTTRVMPPGADPRCIDLLFTDFVADPRRAVADLCRQLGLAHDAAIADAMDVELAEQQARKANQARLRFPLETFGIDSTELQARCAPYTEAFLR